MQSNTAGQMLRRNELISSPVEVLTTSNTLAATCRLKQELHLKASDRFVAFSEKFQNLPMPINVFAVPLSVICLKWSMDEIRKAEYYVTSLARANEYQKMALASHIVGSEYVLPACPGNERLLKIRERHPTDMIILAQIMINDIGDDILRKFPIMAGIVIDIHPAAIHCKVSHKEVETDDDLTQVVDATAFLKKAFADLSAFISANLQVSEMSTLDAAWVRLKGQGKLILNCIIPRREFDSDAVMSRIDLWARGQLDPGLMDGAQLTHAKPMKM